MIKLKKAMCCHRSELRSDRTLQKESPPSVSSSRNSRSHSFPGMKPLVLVPELRELLLHSCYPILPWIDSHFSHLYPKLPKGIIAEPWAEIIKWSASDYQVVSNVLLMVPKWLSSDPKWTQVLRRRYQVDSNWLSSGLLVVPKCLPSGEKIGPQWLSSNPWGVIK